MRADDLPLEYNAIDILERNLVDRADKVALYSDSRNLTFRQVSEESNRVGNALKRLGVRPGECVGILAFDGPEWVTSFFGTLKIGAIAIGVNTLLKSHEYDYILNDSRARVLIVQEPLLGAVDEIRAKQRPLEHVVVLGSAERSDCRPYADWISAESSVLATTPTHREDFCSLNYSSGTTGEPKGILHAHKDYPLTAHNWGVNVLGLREDDRTFGVAKLFFTFGTGGNLIFPWYVGASVVLYAGAPRITTSVLQQVDRYQPTIFYNAPTGYAAALAVPSLTQKYNLKSLRLCVSAGESLPAPVWQQWKDTTGLDIIDGIGSTEMFHIFISNRPDDIRPGSSGKPFAAYDVKLVDDDGHGVPHGEVGNLWVRGETAALSYLHQYDRSRQTFVGEWVVTGDKYRVDADGYYWHAGRSDDMLKVGGIFVSPTEVESALLGHASVQECAVVGRRDHSDLVKPAAYVVLRPEVQPTDELAQEMIEHCRSTMAEYKRPRWIEFVAELPKTATGKIQRFKLRS